MGIAENKATVLDFMARLSTEEPAWDLLDDNARWWIQGRGDLTKAEFRQTAEGVRHITTGQSRMTIDHVTAEDDRVAVESHSHIPLKDGRVFQNTYHFLFILKDGRIVEAHEHFDTGMARDFFGAAAQAALIASSES